MQKINFEDNDIVLLINILRNVMNGEIKTYLQSQNIETFMDLSVISVAKDSSKATLKDLVTNEVYENIPNYTGVQLQPKNIVRMYQGGGRQFIGQSFVDKRVYLTNVEKEGEK